jgi:hypothetical protein
VHVALPGVAVTTKDEMGATALLGGKVHVSVMEVHVNEVATTLLGAAGIA